MTIISQVFIANTIVQGLYYIILAMVTLVYLVCSLRTNVCLFLALFFLVVAYCLYGAVHFYLATGEGAFASKMEMVRY